MTLESTFCDHNIHGTDQNTEYTVTVWRRYVIEVPHREAYVVRQAEQFGNRGRLRTIPAVTPHSPPFSDRIDELSQRCGLPVSDSVPWLMHVV